jgi:hypothetical protein
MPIQLPEQMLVIVIVRQPRVRTSRNTLKRKSGVPRKETNGIRRIIDRVTMKIIIVGTATNRATNTVVVRSTKMIPVIFSAS